MVVLKKAQLETIGLIIIVAILAFVLIFALQFIIKQEPNLLNERYLQLQSNNLRAVILKTNICSAATIRKEIVNCNFDTPVCLNDCEELNSIIKEIIESSLQPRIKYQFSVESDNPINIKRGNCLNPITAVSEPIADTNIKISLKLCEN